MKEAIGTQVTFTLKIKLEKSIFSKNITIVFKRYCGFNLTPC